MNDRTTTGRTGLRGQWISLPLGAVLVAVASLAPAAALGESVAQDRTRAVDVLRTDADAPLFDQVQSGDVLPDCITEMWDQAGYLRITDHPGGRDVLAIDADGTIAYHGDVTDAEQPLPDRWRMRVDQLDRLPGIAIFRYHVPDAMVEVDLEPEALALDLDGDPPVEFDPSVDATESQGVDLAIYATTYLVDEGLWAVGNQPMHQLRCVTVHQLVCDEPAVDRHIEVTVPHERLVLIAAEQF